MLNSIRLLMSRSPKVKAFLPILTTSFLVGTALAEKPASEYKELPLWEFGIFSGVAEIPHYPGSSETDTYVLPLPFFIYRGDRVQSDREGLKSVFVDTDHWKINMSLSGKPPVQEDNKAREGMPELHPLLELGPALSYFFIREPDLKLYFFSALREVSEWDLLDVRHAGFRGTTELIAQKKIHLRDDDVIHCGFRFGAVFSDADYHAVFYDVPAAFATETRMPYRTGGGYSGLILSSSLLYRFNDRLALGGFLKYDYLPGADFEDSPLVQQDDNITAGIAMIWTARKSSKTVLRKEIW